MAYCAGDEWSEVLSDVDETDNGGGNDDFYEETKEQWASVTIFGRFSSVERLLLFWLEATSSQVCQNFIYIIIFWLSLSS